MSLVSIYAYWEDKTRGRIAAALGIEKNAVESDLFGDLGKLRNLILHTGSLADARVLKLKVLNWFQPGDKIVIDRERLHEVIKLIREFPNGLRTEGYIPG